MSIKKNNEKENNIDGLNEGTKLKQKLQERALKFMADYPDSQTLESFAEFLCWDLNMTYRNVLESYINPMMRHGYLIYEGHNLFSFRNGKENKQIKKGKIGDISLNIQYQNYVEGLKEGEKKISYDEFISKNKLEKEVK